MQLAKLSVGFTFNITKRYSGNQKKKYTIFLEQAIAENEKFLYNMDTYSHMIARSKNREYC